MITITNSSRDLSKVEAYLMTQSPAIITMQNVEDNTVIPVDAWVQYEDVKEDGEIVELLSILTPDKKVYSAQSGTFKRSFADIAAIFDGEPYSVVKISGKTKAGRGFVNCILDTDSIG